MKPKNFPLRKLKRQAKAENRKLTPEEIQLARDKRTKIHRG
jgi:hypothetical protein